MLRYSVVLLGLWVVSAQNNSYPLEDVKISGSQVAPSVVMEIGGLKLGQSLNKAGIEDACQKLGQSGIFEEVSYQYAAGPKKGYVVTLQLTDPRKLLPASFDIAGVDENALWNWIRSQFPTFQHKVPQADEAQQFLAGMVERRLGARLHGEHVVTRMESDLARHSSLVSFQPEHLPRIAEMKFDGANRLPAAELSQIMQKVLGDDGYSQRHFRNFVEVALRQAYEQHGMFKVQFPSIQSTEVTGSALSVTTTIVEGPQYKLADVQFIGDDLPTAAMLKAARFKKGEVANWSEIQQGIWRLEVPVKRTGYMDAVAVPERVLDDANEALVLKLPFRKGPLYHFGEVAFVGLTPEQEAKAQKVWKMKSGDPFDLRYAGDFTQAFGQVIDLKAFNDIRDKIQPTAGDHVENVTISFLHK
jgi:outer membrane protein insertion porin family